MISHGSWSTEGFQSIPVPTVIVLTIFQAVLLVSDPICSATDEAVPAEYASKTMPTAWQTDPKVLAAGKDIYEGKVKPEVNCIKCHGSDGKPTRLGKGARDISDPTESSKHTDAYWFWRISEKKTGTTMPGYKDKLTEEQRWQVIAHLRTFEEKSK